tara:strand:+ start:1880 stop:2110 length:231 start_codon:yes stop_codon:yes gene_type:complete
VRGKDRHAEIETAVRDADKRFRLEMTVLAGKLQRRLSPEEFEDVWDSVFQLTLACTERTVAEVRRDIFSDDKNVFR